MLACRLDIFVDLRRIHVESVRIFAFRANFVALPVTRSLKRAPTTIRRSHSVHAEIGGLGAVHTYHAGIKLIGAVKSALFPSGCRQPAPGSCGRRCCNLLGRLRKHRAAAHEDKRLSGNCGSCRDARVHVLFGDRESVCRIISSGCLILIFAQGSAVTSLVISTSTGPGRPDWAMVKARRMVFGQLCDILYNKIVFGNRHGHAGDIDLLEAVPAQKAYRPRYR